MNITTRTLCPALKTGLTYGPMHAAKQNRWTWTGPIRPNLEIHDGNAVHLLPRHLPIIYFGIEPGIGGYVATLQALDSGRRPTLVTARGGDEFKELNVFTRSCELHRLKVHSPLSRAKFPMFEMFEGSSESKPADVNPFYSLHNWPGPEASSADCHRIPHPFQASMNRMSNTPKGIEEFALYLDQMKGPALCVCTDSASLAELLRKYPQAQHKMKAIVIKPEPTKLLDILTISNASVPKVIIPRKLCEKYVFSKESLRELFDNRDNMSPFGNLFLELVLSQEIHRSQENNSELDPSMLSRKSPVLTDLLLMFLVQHPEFIEGQMDPTGKEFHVTSIRSPNTVLGHLTRILRADLMPLPEISTVSAVQTAISSLAPICSDYLFPLYMPDALTYVHRIPSRQLPIDEKIKKTSSDMRVKLLRSMQLSPDTSLVTILGNPQIGKLGCIKADRFLLRQLSKNEVWSYKCSGNDGFTQTISALVHASDHADKTIGCLDACEKSPDEQHKGPKLDHYVVTYGKPETSFGGGITAPSILANRMLLLDGNAEDFFQACLFLFREQPITATFHCTENARSFSAAEFLMVLRRNITQYRDYTNSEPPLDTWFHEYVKNRPLTDPAQQKILTDAWQLFTKYKLYNKLDSFTQFELPLY